MRAHRSLLLPLLVIGTVAVLIARGCALAPMPPCTTQLTDWAPLAWLSLSPNGEVAAIGLRNPLRHDNRTMLIDLQPPSARRDIVVTSSDPRLSGLTYLTPRWRDAHSGYAMVGNELSEWDPATGVVTPVLRCADCGSQFDVSSTGAIARVRRVTFDEVVLEMLEPDLWRVTLAITRPRFLTNPRWSPSGNLLLVDDGSGAAPKALLLDVRSGTFISLPEAIGPRLIYAWQPWLSDDEILLGESGDSAGKALWRYNVRSQTETLFVRVGTPYWGEKRVTDYAIDRSGRRLVAQMDGTLNVYAFDIGCLAARQTSRPIQ